MNKIVNEDSTLVPNNSDLELAHMSLHDISTMTLEEFIPEKEVSTTVVQMLQNRIYKLDKEDRFNDLLKRTLSDRLPEATWSEVAQLLTTRENIENMKVAGILTPFIPKEGANIPLIEQNQKAQQNDAKLNENATKEVIQAFDLLQRMMADAKSRQAKALEAKEIAASSNQISDEV